MKQKSYGVRGDILNIFLSLKLKEIQLVEEDEKKKMSHKEKQQMSRKDRKVCKYRVFGTLMEQSFLKPFFI